jgi:hypothetical protein
VKEAFVSKESEPATREAYRLERLAESAYEAMYDAQRHNVKDHFEDALAYYRWAIDAAHLAGLESEIERLTRRVDHISNVYNSQFRYI